MGETQHVNTVSVKPPPNKPLKDSRGPQGQRPCTVGSTSTDPVPSSTASELAGRRRGRELCAARQWAARKPYSSRGGTQGLGSFQGGTGMKTEGANLAAQEREGHSPTAPIPPARLEGEGRVAGRHLPSGWQASLQTVCRAHLHNCSAIPGERAAQELTKQKGKPARN